MNRSTTPSAKHSNRTQPTVRPRSTVAFVTALSGATVVAALLGGCGEATTGDDPTARVPRAPYSSPDARTGDAVVDRYSSDDRYGR